MLYLIHDVQRQKIMQDYYIRVWQSLSWALVVVCIIAGVLFIPTLVLLQTEVKVSTDSIAALEAEIQAGQSASSETEATKIANKITILQQTYPTDVRQTYLDVERILDGVEGVRLTSVSVDSVSKTIQMVMQVRDKDVAKDLVDALKKTSYKGADLPYSVLSQKGSFTFAQNLTYE